MNNAREGWLVSQQSHNRRVQVCSCCSRLQGAAGGSGGLRNCRERRGRESLGLGLGLVTLLLRKRATALTTTFQICEPRATVAATAACHLTRSSLGTASPEKGTGLLGGQDGQQQLRDPSGCSAGELLLGCAGLCLSEQVHAQSKLL